jgi:hypothetical protein
VKTVLSNQVLGKRFEAMYFPHEEDVHAMWEQAVPPVVHGNQLAFAIVGRAKATIYLLKVVAASHFPLIVATRSLTYLLTCRALTVAAR